MSRLDFSPAVAGYLERHAIDPQLARELGVRSRGDQIVYPVDPPGDAESYERTRDLNDERKRTMQPKGTPLTLWWPAGRADPGAEVLLCEGEADALAALSALNGDPLAVTAVPGVTIPAERVTAELSQAAAVYLALDADEEGRKAADKFARALQAYTTLKVVLLGDGEDLASRLYAEDDRPGWLRATLAGAPEAPHLAPLKAEPTGGYGPTKKRRGGDRDDRDPGEAFRAPLATIAREEVHWLWPERVPRGMITLLIGDPGVGKSMFSLYLAALVSKADGDVLLCSAEDHAGATIRPRAEALGADLDRIHVVGMRREGIEEGIALPDDVGALEGQVQEVRARLVVIDPLMAHLPEAVNSWRDQSVRRALAPVHRIAESHGCSMLVILHMNKMRGADPLYRAGGSVGIPAAARSALLLARDPDDEERGDLRVLAHVKSNVAPLAESLSGRIGVVELEDGPDMPRFEVLGPSSHSAHDLLEAPSGEDRTERDEATDFLAVELADGARPVKKVRATAKANGISDRTLDRAKERLGVTASRISIGNEGEGEWQWSL